MSADERAKVEPARRGRPRKWGSEAERKRAYRARKAEDLAEPQRLRLELRSARGEIRRLEKQNVQFERLIVQAERSAAKDLVHRAELETEIERRDNSIAFWQRRAEIAEREAWPPRQTEEARRRT
jgi:hypothetical protein